MEKQEAVEERGRGAVQSKDKADGVVWCGVVWCGGVGDGVRWCWLSLVIGSFSP